MRVLILWADHASPNLGVRALAEGTAALVRRVWPDADCTVHNYGGSEVPVRVGDPRALAREWVTGRDGLAEWVREFDLVVDTRSGDSFADIYGLRRLLAMSAFGEFITRSGVPLVLGPQTIGPFASRRGRLLGRRSLRRATRVLARDTASAEYAAGLGRPVDAVTADVVFALDAPPRNGTRDVLLNVSGLLWRPGAHVDSAAYQRTVTDLYNGLRARGRTVSLLAHVLDSPSADNDVAAITDFVTRHDPAAEVLVPGSLTEVRELVAGAELVLGSRMHACLNALSVGTPAIPLAYSRKFVPLLEDLGWGFHVDLRTGEDPAAAALQMVDDDRLEKAAVEVGHRAHELLGRAEQTLRSAV